MNRILRNGIAALTLGAMTLGGIAATPAAAKRHDNGRHEGWRDRDRDGRHDRYEKDRGRHHDSRGRDARYDRHDRYDRRADRRVVVVHRYDWNRPDPRYRGYYANNYYRSSGYRPIIVDRQTRIYRGRDDRYYCRRSDGTTGLIVGAAIGGVLGDRIDRGNSSILGAVLGASAGGLLGRELDRGSVSCR
jgi:hypothetical protein